MTTRTSQTDEELVALATAGDLDCFNQLVARWERPIYALRIARSAGKRTPATSSRSFSAGLPGAPRLPRSGEVLAWLYRITLNLCRDWVRRERRAPVVQLPEGTDPIEVADERVAPAESVEDLVARKQMSEAVGRAMTELPEEQRVAILLKEFHGLTFQEIADELDCPLRTVKTRLYQGLSVLRRRLERRQSEEARPRRATWESSST